MNLTITQQSILMSAATRDSKAIVLPPTLRGGAATKTIDAMTRAGLVMLDGHGAIVATQTGIDAVGGSKTIELPPADDPLAIPGWLRRKPVNGAPPPAVPTNHLQRNWIMPKSTKSKPAKSQMTDPAIVAAKKAAKDAKKQRGAESKAKTTSMPAANIKEYIARGKVRGLAIAPADGSTKPAPDGATAPAADGAAPRKHREGTKQAKLIEMLRRPEGATIAQIVAETKWQQHTVRGAIAGALKKKLGLDVISEKVDGARVYRIVGEGEK